LDKVKAEIDKNTEMQVTLHGLHPVALACKDGELECIDFFLTLREQSLDTFLSAPRRGGRIFTDLRLISTPISVI
jgi:hypothetical protein